MKKKLIISCAIIVVIAVGVGMGYIVRHNISEESGKNYPSKVKTVLAAYPDPVAADASSDDFLMGKAYQEWREAYGEQWRASSEIQPELENYYASLMKYMLTSKDENTVCSPVNIYMALAMLAEVTDGNTRQQIVEALGASDIEELRANASTIWASNYADIPCLKSLLANSLWLNNEINYNEDTLERLAKQYYASSFRGVPGSADMNKALQNWTDENTHGLLSDYTKDLSLDPETVMGLVSTIYYKASWADKFKEENTRKEVFHGLVKDTTVDMMKRTALMSVYCSEEYMGLRLGLSESGAMYFLLPNEGVAVDSLLEESRFMRVLNPDRGQGDWLYARVNMSVPKFKVSAKTDLLEGIRALGMSDVLNANVADFTPLISENDKVYLSSAEHAAMLEIDEQGVTGAAYTALRMAGSAFPNDEIDFVIDRPFMFIVTGRDNSILFSGIVRDIK